MEYWIFGINSIDGYVEAWKLQIILGQKLRCANFDQCLGICAGGNWRERRVFVPETLRGTSGKVIDLILSGLNGID